MLSIKGRYERLWEERRPYIERGKQCARVTLPFLLLREDEEAVDSHRKIVTPWQGIGARGVNNLASKLLLTLFPPNHPFFRLVAEDLGDGVDEDIESEINTALSKIERRMQREMEAQSLRAGIFEILRHLIVTGNGLLYVRPEGGVIVHPLSRYVVERTPGGEVLEILVREQKKRIGADGPQKGERYTRIWQDGERWRCVTAEDGREEEEGVYPRERSPWIVLRFLRMDGESYGRGLVEEYLGDLEALERLSQAIVEGSALASKVLYLLRANGTLREKDLAEAANGAIKIGAPEDIHVMQVNKGGDFSVALQATQVIEQRLAAAFLLNSSIQRPGERVTAEEIRHMAGELEDTLGGVYSILSQEFQLPLLQRFQYQMEQQGKIPALPAGVVRPIITTGLEALGRGHDLYKLQSFMSDLGQLGQVFPQIIQRINVEGLIQRLGAARGIDVEDVLLPTGAVGAVADVR